MSGRAGPSVCRARKGMIMAQAELREKDRPWLMRTYSGYANSREANQLYRSNLAKGQTGLSIAFDLPTQTGYDPDHVLAKGEVGKLGVSISTSEDMDLLFDQIPVEQMNTSMTINAPAAWILALYLTTAGRQGADISSLRGTLQNDILKEYLSRGTYIFPPAPSMRLTAEVIAYTVTHIPKWNPVNICSYHLQESGATPVQEVAFTLANAIAVLDEVKSLGRIPADAFPAVVGRISFFLNAGIRFVEETCKMRVFQKMWDRICRERYGVQDPKLRRFRYGIQVNSLGLTQQQPENNIARIVYELLGAVLSKRGRARSVQLPAWNEALGLPRRWDQQLSLRLQQILAYETDLLEYEDIFDGSHVVEARQKQMEEAADAELEKILDMGGAVAAIENGYMKHCLVESNARRLQAIESGEQVVVGVNEFATGEPSPLLEGRESAFLKVDEAVEAEQVETLHAFKKKRNPDAVARALDQLRHCAESGENIMESSLSCAEAGVTTGEWADALRRVFGEYQAPTGVQAVPGLRQEGEAAARVVQKVKELNRMLGRNIRILIGKPGLDGHSNGAEQVAVKARAVGMDVVYEGIRLTPERIAESALQEGVHVVGLSIHSGSHSSLVPEVRRLMDERGMGGVPIVLGGIIPREDMDQLSAELVRRIYTPKDFQLNSVMSEIVDIVARSNQIELEENM